MMKKIMMALLASTLLFSSGCSLFDKDKTMSLKDAQKMAQENPSELFYTLSKANGEYTHEQMKKYIPSIQTLERYTSQYSENISFDLANTSLGGGKGTYTLSATSEGDFRNLQNPKQKTDFTLVADIMGGMFSADIKATMTVVEKSLFLSFEKMNMNMMMMPAEAKTAIESLTGKTFGNSFDEIKALSQEELDIGKYFMSGGIWLSTARTMEEMVKNPQDYMTFGKFIKEENGYFYFEASVNPLGQEKAMAMVKNMLPFGKSFEAEMQTTIDAIKQAQTQPVILAYNPLNRKYFIQESTSPFGATAKAIVKNIENEFSASLPLNETDSIVVQKKGNEVMVMGQESGKDLPLIKGSLDEKTMNLDIMNPDDGSVVAKITGTQEKNGWQGEITSTLLEELDPMLKGAKIVFSNVIASPEKYALTLEAQLNNASVGKMEWVYTIKGASGNLNLEKPTNALPFLDITKTFEALDAAPFEEEEEWSEEEVKALESQMLPQ